MMAVVAMVLFACFARRGGGEVSGGRAAAARGFFRCGAFRGVRGNVPRLWGSGRGGAAANMRAQSSRVEEAVKVGTLRRRAAVQITKRATSFKAVKEAFKGIWLRRRRPDPREGPIAPGRRWH